MVISNLTGIPDGYILFIDLNFFIIETVNFYLWLAVLLFIRECRYLICLYNILDIHYIYDILYTLLDILDI